MLTYLWLFSFTASFCRLCLPLDCYLKLTVLFGPTLSTDSLSLLWDLPSLLHFRSHGRSHPQALCTGFAPKQTNRFSDRHTHTPTQRIANTVSHSISGVSEAISLGEGKTLKSKSGLLCSGEYVAPQCKILLLSDYSRYVAGSIPNVTTINKLYV